MHTREIILSAVVGLCVLQTVMAGCSVTCSWGKRSDDSGNLPCDFESYDRNSDGAISLREMTAVAGAGVGKTDMKPFFKSIDKNGDNKIDRREFKNSPLYADNC